MSGSQKPEVGSQKPGGAESAPAEPAPPAPAPLPMPSEGGRYQRMKDGNLRKLAEGEMPVQEE